MNLGFQIREVTRAHLCFINISSIFQKNKPVNCVETKIETGDARTALHSGAYCYSFYCLFCFLPKLVFKFCTQNNCTYLQGTVRCKFSVHHVIIKLGYLAYSSLHNSCPSLVVRISNVLSSCCFETFSTIELTIVTH